MQRITTVPGTRSEAIKWCPLILKMRASGIFHVDVCIKGQHRQMFDQVLEISGVAPCPEEGNRIAVGHSAEFHFCQTEKNRRNLLNEEIANQKITIIGNTVIDTLHFAQEYKLQMNSQDVHRKMQRPRPYGDDHACEHIVEVLIKVFGDR